MTGGSGGIGRAIACALAAAGARVAVIARSPDKLAETAASITAADGTALPIVADVTDEPAVRQAVDQIERELGPVDLLVNNAGTAGPVAPLWEADPADWWKAVEVNLRSAFLCCRAVLPGMVSRRRGRIVNVASHAGVYRWPYLASYSVSKAALVKMTENLAVETKKHRVKLFSINPGLLRAGMTESLLSAEVPPESPVALVAAWARHEIEAQGDVSPERGAELVVALASGKADALSGRYISVHDDLDDLVERAATIVHKDLYTLRLRQS